MGNVITYDKIESYAYSNILSIIDNRSYIVDPKRKDMTNASTQKRKFVYDKDPFMKSINFDDMPYIILELPRISDDAHSVNGKYENVIGTQRIVVRTKIDGASNVDVDTGRSDMLDICDDLQQTFKNITRREELAGWNMRNVVLTKVRVDTYAIDAVKDIYESEYEISYSTRIAVSV